MPFRSAAKRSRIDALGAVLVAAVLALSLAGCGKNGADGWRTHVYPDRIALRSALNAPDKAMLREVYAARGFEPIWIGDKVHRNGAREFVQRLQGSGRDGLNPEKYDADALYKRLDNAWEPFIGDRARTELQLTSAYIEYIHDLHTPAAGHDLAYTDPDLQPGMRDRAQIARQLAASAYPQTAVKNAIQMNGFYVRMRDALARQRLMTPGNKADEQRLLINLDRLRALPTEMGNRFVLVDIVANRLWLYDDNRPVDSMKVIVGAPNGQTPQMAALIRYAIYNPFWNVPPDLTRDNYAPRIAAKPSALSDLRMDAWSGFTANAQILDPRAIDWNAVSRGETIAWLRQRPGPENSMGAAKFMLPNELGIYLHDTPQRELFDQAARFFSAGCIRVEDYHRLSRWLFGGVEIRPQGPAAEQRFDLPAPVPVYIVYLTARAANGTVQVMPDVYGRDSAPAPVVPAPAAAPKAPAASRELSPGAAAPAGPAPVPAPAPAAPIAAAPAAQPVQPPVRPAAPPAPAPVQRPAPIPAAPAAKPVQPPVRPAAPPVQRPAPVAAPRPAPAAVPAPSPAPASGSCRIQAGVFGQRANADNLVKTLRPLGDVRMTEVMSNGKAAYSIAIVGLASRADAESVLAKVNSGGKLGARITGCRAAG